MPRGKKTAVDPKMLDPMLVSVDEPTEEVVVSDVTREEVDALKADVAFLNETVANLISRVGDKCTPSVAREPQEDGETPIIKAEEKLSDVSSVVHEVLGAEFDSIVEPNQVGVSFLVKIFPPAHLREREGDMRAKVISNVEGLAGVRAYCEKVKKHIVDWAHKNGKVYASA